MTKPKTCQHCGTTFTPQRMAQRVCGPVCAGRKVRADRKAKQAQERKQTRARRESLKPRAKWLSECQAIVNKIVRLRDIEDGCISCHRGPDWPGQWHASHLRSVGAASAVRFHLWNIHKACSICNNHKSGNLADYLPRVRTKIGDEKVDWLYQQNQLVRYEVDYLKRFKAVMGKRFKRMEKQYAC